MVKRKALMESLSANLHSFLKQTGKNLPLPDKKFLRDGLVGLVRGVSIWIFSFCPRGIKFYASMCGIRRLSLHIQRSNHSHSRNRLPPLSLNSPLSCAQVWK